MDQIHLLPCPATSYSSRGIESFFINNNFFNTEMLSGEQDMCSSNWMNYQAMIVRIRNYPKVKRTRYNARNSPCGIGSRHVEYRLCQYQNPFPKCAYYYYNYSSSAASMHALSHFFFPDQTIDDCVSDARRLSIFFPSILGILYSQYSPYAYNSHVRPRPVSYGSRGYSATLFSTIKLELKTPSSK